MAQAAFTFPIPSDVPVTYDRAAEVLSCAKASTLAEFGPYLASEGPEDEETFYEQVVLKSTLDERMPGWVESLITKKILGVHNPDNSFPPFASLTPHRSSLTSEETEMTPIQYDANYPFCFAARAAVRKDATELEIRVGLAAATNIAKVCRSGLPDFPIGGVQASIVTGCPSVMGEAQSEVALAITLHSAAVAAKHILLERARLEGWTLGDYVTGLVNDRVHPFMMDARYLSNVPAGPAYRPSTWREAADPATEPEQYRNMAAEDDGPEVMTPERLIEFMNSADDSLSFNSMEAMIAHLSGEGASAGENQFGEFLSQFDEEETPGAVYLLYRRRR